MKRFFDKVLLAGLWLITATIATAFWMNTRYGFNILSSAHWAYLSELQANRTNIKNDFYISLVAAAVIALVGLYLIIRPHRRKIVLAQGTKKEVSNITTEAVPEQQKQVVSAARRPIAPAGLGFGVRNSATPVPHPTATAYSPQITPPNAEPSQNPLATEILSIFESAGYIIKKCNKINGLKNPVMAIGYNQQIWLGSSNIAPEIMQDAIESLVAIFDDTLGDTAQDIEIRGVIVNPTSKENSSPDLITIFDNTKELQNFIEPNEKPADFDRDLFDAFSTYIDTVSGYIGK